MATKDAQGNLHDDNNGRFTNKQGGYQESVMKEDKLWKTLR